MKTLSPIQKKKNPNVRTAKADDLEKLLLSLHS